MENLKNEHMKNRLEETFRTNFGYDPTGFMAAPGRVELLGNHTDHQHGKVLAASIDKMAYAVYAPNGTDTVTIISEGYAPIHINIRELMPDVSEFNTSKALIRGVLNGFYSLHHSGKLPGDGISGFDAVMISEVLTGSGLSSSAAFEVLLGRILNNLFFENAATPIQIAKIGQAAENRFFGKPCGLMDQAASSIGGVVFFDFRDPENPSAEQIPFSFHDAGYALCAVACGGGHADLTEEYAKVPADMRSVAEYFGKTILLEVDEDELYRKEAEIRGTLGSRPFLRSVHFFEETKRAEQAAEALKKNDIRTFLKLANASGISSRTKLSNIIPESKPEERRLDTAMRTAVSLLGGKQTDGSKGSGMKGAVRMNGGGFSGTFLAVVPLEMLDDFQKNIDMAIGDGSCMILNA